MDSLQKQTTEQIAASIIYWRNFKRELSEFDTTQRALADEHLSPLYDELDRREAAAEVLGAIHDREVDEDEAAHLRMVDAQDEERRERYMDGAQ
jgi:hypothetical protein